jgi:hypothetical protein
MKAVHVILFTLLLGAAWLIVWDIYLFHTGGHEATISWQVLTVSRKHPVVPLLVGFVVGLLGGHLFWSQ